MAQPMATGQVLGQAAPVLSPLPSSNQVDSAPNRTAKQEARHILDFHRNALRARMQGDLLSQKLLLHVDGSSDFQWADIVNNSRVEIPAFVSEYWKTENILRLIVAHAVASHTSMPLRYLAESTPDRKSKNRAIVDTVWMNHLAREQNFNALFASALTTAMSTGFNPVHFYWREDVEQDWYEAVGYGESQQPARGRIDAWVGNPFDTVFDVGARRGSFRVMQYGRLVPGADVRRTWDHIPGIRNLEGSKRIPSVAMAQRIMKSWSMGNLGSHGTPLMGTRSDQEDVMSLICRETAPGVDPTWPQGRLQIIAVPGAVDAARGEGGAGDPVIAVDQPLPAADFSASIFYSDHRGDDVHGKPWIEDLDQQQVDLNIALSKRWEQAIKTAEAPIVTPAGAMSQDMSDFGGYNLLEIEPSLSAWQPRVMELPQSALAALDLEVNDRRKQIYSAGGYQAVSRGESLGSRTAYRTVLALQNADSSIHAPVNQRFQVSACDAAGKCWSQMKAYGDRGWLVRATGDEYAHLAGTYIANIHLSDERPSFRLVNAFGTSPELRAQELLELGEFKGADGQPLLPTEMVRRLYPDQSIFGSIPDPNATKRLRAMAAASRIEELTAQFRQQTGMTEMSPVHPWVQQAAQIVFQAVEQEFRRKRDDDLMASIAALSELTQDPGADPIAALAAEMRQQPYYEWQAQMAAGAPPPGAPGPQAGPPQPGGPPAAPSGLNPRAVAAQGASRPVPGDAGSTLGTTPRRG